MNNRIIAYKIIYDVIFNNQYSNLSLNKLRTNVNFSDYDLSFITKITYGVIERKIYFEYVINKLIEEDKTSNKIKTLLWMACYEYLILEKPIYAVVNEYVDASKEIEINASGFVNKILKSLFAEPSFFQVKIKNKKNVAALENGIAFWMFQKFSSDFGDEVAKKIVANINKPKQNSYRINTIKTSEASFYQNLNMDFDFTPSKISRNSFTTNLNLIHSKLFIDGFIYAQDQCSILASQILNPSQNSKVLDMCCAPGGKLSHLGALMLNTGQLIGNDISKNKKTLIEDNLTRLGVSNCTLIFEDALNIKDNEFDFILLDAPCSGLGLMKTKPEIRLKKPIDVLNSELINLQSQLLEKAGAILKAGGYLVYSTCTINKDENSYQIQKFLDNNKNFIIAEEHQFFGFEYNSDGFYICKLKKINN